MRQLVFFFERFLIYLTPVVLYVWMPLLRFCQQLLETSGRLTLLQFVKRQQLHTPTVRLDATVNLISNQDFAMLKGSSCTLRRYVWMPLLTLLVTKILQC